MHLFIFQMSHKNLAYNFIIIIKYRRLKLIGNIVQQEILNIYSSYIYLSFAR